MIELTSIKIRFDGRSLAWPSVLAILLICATKHSGETPVQTTSDDRNAELDPFQTNFSVETGINLVHIQAGTFLMGSPTDEPKRQSDEGPQTLVTITKDFYIGATDVTQGQYSAVMGSNPSFHKSAGKDAPVEQVSWFDAIAFCQRLTDRERDARHLPKNYAFTLPTEAQWEYACRAGTTGPYFGDLEAMAWFGEGTNMKRGGRITHPVATKMPNAWGIYDMEGNVREWCLDWWGSYSGGEITDPSGGSIGPFRVVRGSCWVDPVDYCRSACRFFDRPESVSGGVGFRIVLASTALGPPRTRMIQKTPEISLTDLPRPSPPIAFATYISDLAARTGIKLVMIPKGTFLMGSAEPGHDRDQGPQTRVTLTKDYYLGATDITQRQYELVMGNNPSVFKSSDKDAPVENISWSDAISFCMKLNEKERSTEHLPRPYILTLPTEAQWEYACRAGTTGPYAGDIEAMAWGAENSGGVTHPVGQKQPNAWGLYDMYGNVWEFCLDRYWNYPGGALTDPARPVTGFDCVCRGGCWTNDLVYCRSTVRLYLPIGSAGSIIGFRIALSSVDN